MSGRGRERERGNGDELFVEQQQTAHNKLAPTAGSQLANSLFCSSSTWPLSLLFGSLALCLCGRNGQP